MRMLTFGLRDSFKVRVPSVAVWQSIIQFDQRFVSHQFVSQLRQSTNYLVCIIHRNLRGEKGDNFELKIYCDIVSDI